MFFCVVGVDVGVCGMVGYYVGVVFWYDCDFVGGLYCVCESKGF